MAYVGLRLFNPHDKATGLLEVRLASSTNRPRRPTMVLIHGLDSAKDTFSSVVSELAKDNYPAIALDLRGHGESPMGDPSVFSTQALAKDIHHATLRHGVEPPFVLVGHSMGGRVVMRYAQDMPEDIAALVIEDMDLTPRLYDFDSDSDSDSDSAPGPNSNDHESGRGKKTKERDEKLGQLRAFSRDCGSSFEECKEVLAAFGYDRGRIDGWRSTGRVFQRADGKWWSNINPFARHLAMKHVLSGSEGRTSFRSLAKTLRKEGSFDFPVHLFVAGKGSAVAESGPDGVEGMVDIMPSLQVTRFPRAYHSIHNTDREKFLSALKAIADEAEMRQALVGEQAECAEP